MRTPQAVVAGLACLIVGAAAAGCTDATTVSEPSADQILDRANDTMRGLTSVTVDAVTTWAAGDQKSSHLTTDLKGTCAFTAGTDKGTKLEQIRIGDTNYVRPNRAYLKVAGQDTAGKPEQKYWVKYPSGEADPFDGLSDCTEDIFASFGVGTKGRQTKVHGSPAVSLTVTDKADKTGSYTFYVATEGKPYILKVAYKSPDLATTTSFSAFDEPLDVRPPAKADVMDVSRIVR